MSEILDNAQTSANATAAESENVASQINPFDENSWSEQPIVENKGNSENVSNGNVPRGNEDNKEEKIFDANAYLKEQLGFEDWGSAKTQIEEWRKPKEAQTPAEIKFANEESKRLFDAWKDGKEDEVYAYLDQKRKLENAEKMDISKATDAAEILKLNLQYKHKDLTKDEVEYLFNREYALPAKPAQRDDQTDEEYEQSLSVWKQQVADVERGMVIQAKLAKPELAKYKNEIIAPEIPKAEPKLNEPTPEELENLRKWETAYLQDVDKGLTTLKGYTTRFKDEEVEIPISYEISNEEKTALKPIMESLGKGYDYFAKRWLNQDGSVNTALMGEDLYLLEYKERVFQKIANESGSQRLVLKMKDSSNIQLGGSPQKAFVPDAEKSYQQRQAEAIWDA